MSELKVADLIEKARECYEKAIELLSQGDYHDAAEKAWNAVEYMRKAFLIALNIPYEKAKTVSQGLVLFSDILRKLGRREILKTYDQLMLKLHVLGFYEQITPPDEIDELIRTTTRYFISQMEDIINRIKGIDLSQVAKFIDKMAKIKSDIVAKSAELYEVRQSYIAYIERALAKISKQKE